MFVDTAQIRVKAGDGGNGKRSFRREKYVPRGGPDGGDGGSGGEVVLQATIGLSTLLDFQFKTIYKAENGGHGESNNRAGKDGEDLIVQVPVGTVIKDGESGNVLADLDKNSDLFLAAKGGKGGKGNARFASPINRAPVEFEKGTKGEEKIIHLELKLIADVGIIGCPNAGKSTLLAKLSSARPKIASYPFTTLTPNLGVVRAGDEKSFVLADIPGLVEGAHSGVGLGDRFLRHIERTRVLIHIVDVAGFEGRDPFKDFVSVNEELASYSRILSEKPQIVCANKVDLPEGKENLQRFKKLVRKKVFPISALQGDGLKHLVREVLTKLMRTH